MFVILHNLCYSPCFEERILVGCVCSSSCVLKHNHICSFRKHPFVLDEVWDKLLLYKWVYGTLSHETSEISQFFEPDLILESGVCFACKKLVVKPCAMG